MPQLPSPCDSYRRWCGICFQWRIEKDGRCKSCGNAHMTGGRIPVPTAKNQTEERP